jgi:hypothetical protein
VFDNRAVNRIVRFALILAVLGVFVVIGLFGCSCRIQNDPIIVNVLRDEKSSAFGVTEKKLLTFQKPTPRTSSGRSIVIQSILMNPVKFEETLTNEQSFFAIKPDIVVLDSAEQANKLPGYTVI